MGECAVSYPSEGLAALGLDGGQGLWFDHRADQVAEVLRRRRVGAIWDVGAGAGSMCRRLAARGIEVVAVEPLPLGAKAIAAQGIEVFGGTLEQLTLPDGSLGAVGLFDVIEHVADSRPLLDEVHRVLAPGGVLVVTVPAFNWLWSDEDTVGGHHRRYRRGNLDADVGARGFVRRDTRYIFAALVPVAAVLRALPYRLGRRRSTTEMLSLVPNQLAPSPGVDRFARAVLATERWIASLVPLPFGLSVLGVYERRADE